MTADGLFNRLESNAEMAALEEPVVSMRLARERNPTLGVSSKLNFLCNVSGQRNSSGHGMVKTRTEHGMGFVKVAAGIFLLKGRGANDDAVYLHRSSGRRRNNGEGISVSCRKEKGT